MEPSLVLGGVHGGRRLEVKSLTDWADLRTMTHPTIALVDEDEKTADHAHLTLGHAVMVRSAWLDAQSLSTDAVVFAAGGVRSAVCALQSGLNRHAVVVLLPNGTMQAEQELLRAGASEVLLEPKVRAKQLWLAVGRSVARNEAIAALYANAHAERTAAVGLVAQSITNALRPTLRSLSRAVANPARNDSRAAADALAMLLADLDVSAL